MEIQPIGNRVLVRVKKEDATTKSGILLHPSGEGETKAEGEVIALGTGPRLKETGIEIGNTVLFGQYSGDDVRFENADYKILVDTEILAVIK